jgi:WD40 repeat protein
VRFALVILFLLDVTHQPNRFRPENFGLSYQLGEPNRIYYSLAFSADGKTLYAGTLQGPIQIFDTATGKKIDDLDGHANGVFGLALSPNGKLLASAGRDCKIRIWDTATRKILREMASRGVMFSSIEFSPDGTRLISLSYDNTARLWDPNKGEELLQINGIGAGTRLIAFHRDGSSFAAMGNDGSLNLYRVHDGSIVRTFDTQNRPPTSGTLTRDGRTLIAATQDGALRAWECETGRELPVLSSPSRNRQCHSMAISPDDRYLLAGDQARLKIYEIKSGQRVASLKGHRAMLYSVAVSRNGQWIASGGADGQLILWGVKSRRGWLGVSMVTPQTGGCEVQTVKRGSPAEKAGLRPGDRILKVGPAEIADHPAAVDAIGRYKPGDEVALTIERDGQVRELKVCLGVPPEEE